MLTEYNIAGPPGFVQRAGIVAVREGEPFVAEIVGRYRACRCPGPRRPSTPSYGWTACRTASPSPRTSSREPGVGLAPGAAFGEGDHNFDAWLRLCFAATLPTLERAFDRLADYLASV